MGKLTILILAAGLGLCLLQSAAAEPSSKEPMSPHLVTEKQPRQIYQMVKKPTSAMELLENLKFVIDHDLLLRDDFYTSDNMEEFFGAQNPIGGVDDNTKAKWFRAKYFGHSVPSPKERGNVLSGIGLSLGLHPNAKGKTRSFAGFSFIAGAITFDQVERVFGSAWKEDKRPWPPGRVLFRATAPHGNDRLIYTFDDSSVNRELYLVFRNDGTLDNAGLYVEMK